MADVLAADRRSSEDDRREIPRGGRRQEDALKLRDTISGRVSVAMNRRKMTLIALAEQAEISEGTLRNVLAGKNTTLDTLAAIADALGIPLADLVAARP